MWTGYTRAYIFGLYKLIRLFICSGGLA